MDFLQSKWFMWFTLIIIIITVFRNVWISFIVESRAGPEELWRRFLYIVFFIPMVLIAGIIYCIEKRYWGLIIMAIIMITGFTVAFIFDHGGNAAPWN